MTGGRRARAAFGAAVVVQLAVLYWPRVVGGPESVPHLDKAVHALVFAAVALTGVRAGLPVRPLVAVLAIHAGISEVVQGSLLAGRGADPWDCAADLAGTALGAVLGIATGDSPGDSGRLPRRGRMGS